MCPRPDDLPSVEFRVDISILLKARNFFRECQLIFLEFAGEKKPPAISQVDVFRSYFFIIVFIKKQQNFLPGYGSLKKLKKRIAAKFTDRFFTDREKRPSVIVKIIFKFGELEFTYSLDTIKFVIFGKAVFPVDINAAAFYIKIPQLIRLIAADNFQEIFPLVRL